MPILDEVRITELPGADPLAGLELIPLVQSGVTKTRSAQNLVLEGGLQDHLDETDPHTQYADQANTYTETEVDSLLDDKAAISGQTFTGDIAAPKITASTGVLFGTDTAAANTLDDYERGNWTPVADSGITGWASLESATYVKIGDLVTVNVFVLSVTGKDANQIQLSGLPFASKGGRHFSPGPCEIADLSTSSDSPFVRTNAGADTLKFFKGAREDVAGNDVTGAGNIILTVTYQVA